MEPKLLVFTSLFDSKMGVIKDFLVLSGKEKEVKKMDREYQIRKLFGPWGLEELAQLYQGFSEDKLKEISSEYFQKKLIKGLKGFLLELKNKGFLIGVLSANPQFILEPCKENLPFDFIEGSHLEFKEKIATGKLKKKIDRYIKAEILKKKKIECQLSKENMIGIGRASIVDLPIARETEFFIGFDDSRETIDDVIEVIRENKNLTEIFSLSNKIF